MWKVRKGALIKVKVHQAALQRSRATVHTNATRLKKPLKTDAIHLEDI